MYAPPLVKESNELEKWVQLWYMSRVLKRGDGVGLILVLTNFLKIISLYVFYR